MKNFKTTLVLLLLVGVSFTACKKEKEDVPAPEQTTSINYGNGIIENFQRQPNGSTVVFSNWITKTETNWTGFGTFEIKTKINAPSLTDAVRDNGLLLVYFEYDGNVRPLPAVRIEYGEVVDYSFITQQIDISLRLTGFGNISGVSDMRFRYVLIPSSSFGGSGQGARMQTPVDFNDYKAVCEYYGILK